VALIVYSLRKEVLLGIYENEEVKIEVVEYPISVGLKGIDLRYERMGTKLIQPLFRALDPWSDYHREDYVIKEIKFNEKNIIILEFVGNDILEIPVFLGGFDKESFKENQMKYFNDNKARERDAEHAPRAQHPSS